MSSQRAFWYCPNLGRNAGFQPALEPRRFGALRPNRTAPVFSSLVVRWVAVPSLAIFLAAIPAMAQSGQGDYLFLLASGFLCDVDSFACPGVGSPPRATVTR